MSESSGKGPRLAVRHPGARRAQRTGDRKLQSDPARLPRRLLESGQALRSCDAAQHKHGSPPPEVLSRGQALAELAIFSLMAVLLALSLLAFIPQHRARTVATAAAYSCAQFVSQSPNPNWAVYQARAVARRTWEADWSGTLGVQYDVEVLAPNGPGSAAGCAVFYQAPVLFNGLLGARDPGWSVEWFLTQSEAWKARWR